MDPKRLEKLSPLLYDGQLAERFLAEAHGAHLCVGYLWRAQTRKDDLEAHMSKKGVDVTRSINWREAAGEVDGSTFVLRQMIKGWLADHDSEPSLRIAAAVLREAVQLVQEGAEA